MPLFGVRKSNFVEVETFGALTVNSNYVAREANANLGAIQDAINFAFNQGKQVVQLPDLARFGANASLWLPETPLYLDVPANHAGGVYAVVNANFSMMLAGGGASNTTERGGTILRWKDGYNGQCLVVGPGKGMVVSGVTVRVNHPAAHCRAQYPANSIGISWTSGGSRLTLRDVGVIGARTLIKTGWDDTSLADRLRLDNAYLDRGFYGIYVNATQNFLIDIRDSDIGGCIYNVYNPQQFAVNISGGGFGPVGGNVAVFSISSTSGLRAAGNSYTFTTVVGSPDTTIAASGYNRFVIKTAKFGSVPCLLSSYNAGTITLRIRDSWRLHHFGLLNAITATDLEAELQAASSLFCVEMGTNFYGPVHASEFHAEAPLPYCMLDTTGGATQPSWIRGVWYNGDPSGHDYAASVGAGNASEARHLIAQTHPHFDLGSSPATIEDIYFGAMYASSAICVDMTAPNSITDYGFNRLTQAQLNVRHYLTSGNVDAAENFTANHFTGFGRFDRSPFLPRGAGAAAVRNFVARAGAAVPYLGYRPDPSRMPVLTPNQYAIVSGDFTSIALGSYPPIHGGTIYKVEKAAETATARKFVSSAHVGFSYGQDLTDAKAGGAVSWSFKGASNCVYMDAASLGFMFAGLGIILSFADADHEMVVTGVYPSLGYVTVSKPVIGIGTVTHVINDGTKTTTYTGATIKQAPYVWTTLTLA